MKFLLIFFIFVTFVCCEDFSYYMSMFGKRPNITQRTFNSSVIEDFIQETKEQIASPDLAKLFENCFPNTLDTTIHIINESVFVITGDIPAMWLRDSTNQLMPYIPFMSKDPGLDSLIKKILKTQVSQVLIDPYANAFLTNMTEKTMWKTDRTFMRKGVWERKYEIDSLAAVLKLTNKIIEYTNDTSILDEQWFKAFDSIMKTIKIEQEGVYDSMSGYRFGRESTEPTETLLHKHGNPYKRTGLVRSAFRPSDDACLFSFNIPGNAMLQVELNKIGTILTEKKIDILRGQDALKFAEELKLAIYKYGVTRDMRGNPVFAYEVDGYGNYYKIDDANIPSLLSLPYLGFLSKDDNLYKSTRKFILSEDNPYFYKGDAGEGVGGPHAGDGYVWPMSIIIRAMTSTSDKEIEECIRMLLKTHGQKFFMHESFLQSDGRNYTRPWFSWANSLFGEFIVDLMKNKPHLLKKVY